MTKNQKIKRLEKAYKLLREIYDSSPEHDLADACYPEWFDQLTIAKQAIVDATHELIVSGIKEG